MTVKRPLSYLASPYKKYPAGSEQAHVDICAIAGQLIKAGIALYCPIAHCHPIAVHSEMELHDYALWMPIDKLMMQKCDNLIIAHMHGWDQSDGIAEEIKFFEEMGKPIFDLNITTLLLRRRQKEDGPVDTNWVDA